MAFSIDTINVGSLALPTGPLIILLSMMLSLAVGKWACRKSAIDTEPSLWKIMYVGVLTARAAFVLIYFDIYRIAPWTIIDIRDGGFIIPIGFVSAVITAILIGWRKKEIRKPLLLAVVAGSLTWTVATLYTMNVAAAPIRIPKVALPRLEGGVMHLDKLNGKPIVVNLWATWCAPCRREMPLLRDFQQRNPNVELIFVNQGESEYIVRSYLKQENLQLENVLLDSEMQMAQKTASPAFPTTLFFNEKGVLVDRRVGALSAATFAERVRVLNWIQ